MIDDGIRLNNKIVQEIAMLQTVLWKTQGEMDSLTKEQSMIPDRSFQS